jgi:hypothetical protein
MSNEKIASTVEKLDAIAQYLEAQGLVKEAYSIDVVSNSIEKIAFLDTIKNIVKEIPAASKIRNKEDALAIIWDFVKKIGTEAVLKTIASVEALVSKNGIEDTGAIHTAQSSSALGLTVKSAMYPLLFLAVYLLYMFVGKPQIEQFKNQLQTMQQQQTSVIDQIK